MADNEELLDALLLRCAPVLVHGGTLSDEIQEMRAEVLRRMEPNEPVKTEETEESTFGKLMPGEEFFAHDGSRNRAVSGGGTHAALTLDGPEKNTLWWPGANHIVNRIIT